jgi:hypothetical protein
VDALSGELLKTWPGVCVGPSADGQSAWVFDGWELLPRNLAGLSKDRAAPPAGKGPSAREPDRIRYAFTPQQVRDGDNGALVIAIGYRFGSVYALRSVGQPRELLSRPFGYWPVHAELNATADLVAVSAIKSDPPGDSLCVLVSDSKGAVVARFDQKGSFQWSRDGRCLAMTGWASTSPPSRELLVWDRRKGIAATLHVQPDDFAWTASKDLMLRTGGRVLRFDWRKGDTTATSFQAVDVSPDGAYSMDGISHQGGLHVYDERSGEKITYCSWGAARSVARDPAADPFWIDQRHADHILCVSLCDTRIPGIEGHRAYGCGIATLDLETMELIQTIPGKLVGPTADRNSVVVLRGDSLAIVPLSMSKSDSSRAGMPRRNPSVAKIRAVVEQWSSKIWVPNAPATDTVGVYVLKVREGTWLPVWSGFAVYCNRGMRVSRVLDDGSVEIEYGPASGFVKSWDEATSGTTKKTVVTRTPSRWITATQDAGRTLYLSVVTP